MARKKAGRQAKEIRCKPFLTKVAEGSHLTLGLYIADSVNNLKKACMCVTLPCEAKFMYFHSCSSGSNLYWSIILAQNNKNPPGLVSVTIKLFELKGFIKLTHI